jgi:hypothetical protein
METERMPTMSALEAGSLLVGGEVTITLDAQFVNG